METKTIIILLVAAGAAVALYFIIKYFTNPPAPPPPVPNPQQLWTYYNLPLSKSINDDGSLQTLLASPFPPNNSLTYADVLADMDDLNTAYKNGQNICRYSITYNCTKANRKGCNSFILAYPQATQSTGCAGPGVVTQAFEGNQVPDGAMGINIVGPPPGN